MRRQGFLFHLSPTRMRFMKKLSPVLALLAAFLVAACGLPDNHIRITGEYKNISDAEFYIYDETGEYNIFDTIHISDGRFSYERAVEHPCVLTLLFPNFTQLRLVAEPGKEITVKGEASQLIKTDIGGTKSNEALTRFRLENAIRPASDQTLAAAQFIRSHAADLAAQALFMQYFAEVQTYTRQTLDLLDVMLKAQPHNAALTAYKRRLGPLSKTAVGTPLPAFTAQDIEGKSVSASDYGRQPLVVLFWSSWNSDCRSYAAALRRCRRAYGRKFDVLTLSFDYSVYDAKRRAASDSLQGRLICDGRAFDSPLTRTFGVRYVPGLLLVDKNRKIVARDIAADQLYNALGELIADNS